MTLKNEEGNLATTTVMDFKLAIVAPGLIPVLWSQIEPLLAKVIGPISDTASLEAEKSNFINGSRGLLVVVADERIMSVITYSPIHNDSGLKFLEVPIVSGKGMRFWGSDVLKVLFDIAKNLGCTEIQGYGVQPLWDTMLTLEEFDVRKICTIYRCKVPE